MGIEPRKFSLRDRAWSFVYAFRGLRLMLITQHNAWLHAFFTVCVTIAGLAVGLTRYEWCWITIAIVAVWTAEALNTAFEFLCDVASPEFHPLVEKAKDVAAGAVLISAIGAGIIGLLVIGPRLAILIQHSSLGTQ